MRLPNPWARILRPSLRRRRKAASSATEGMGARRHQPGSRPETSGALWSSVPPDLDTARPTRPASRMAPAAPAVPLVGIVRTTRGQGRRRRRPGSAAADRDVARRYSCAEIGVERLRVSGRRTVRGCATRASCAAGRNPDHGREPRAVVGSGCAGCQWYLLPLCVMRRTRSKRAHRRIDCLPILVRVWVCSPAQPVTISTSLLSGSSLGPPSFRARLVTIEINRRRGRRS